MTVSGASASTVEAPSRNVGLQERIEGSRVGRWLITVFVLVTVGSIVVANLPAGPVQRHLATVTQPYMDATGLAQRWNMFAPYPRTEILYLEARVEHADGRITIWRPPTGGALFGSYRDAHWRKFVEHAVVRPDNSFGWPQLWEPLARYVASQSDDGSPAVRVTLIKRSAFVLAPDKSPPGRTPYRDVAYYTLTLP